MNQNLLFNSLRCIITFFILYEFSLLFLLNPNVAAVSAFFPAPAFIVALTFTQGLRFFPIIFISAVFASFSEHPPWELTLFNWLHISRQTLIYALAGYGLKRLLDVPALNFFDIDAVWRFIVMGLLATACSSVIASALFYTFGLTPLSSLHNIFISFMVGDLTGLLMFTPVAFALEKSVQSANPLQTAKEFVKKTTPSQIVSVILATLLCLGIFLVVIIKPNWSHFYYLVLIPVALVSVKHGVKTAIFSALSVNILTATLYNLLNAQIYSIIEIQMLYAVTALITLLLGSYHDNQIAVNERLRDNQLMLANLMQESSLSELSSTIAHEVASPLQAALMNSQMSMQLLQSDRQIDRDLLLELNQDVEFALNKAVQIHRCIYKGIVEGKSLQIETIAVRQCLNDAQRLLSETITTQNVQIFEQGDMSLIYVNVDKLSLTQVFVNMIKNAIQANSTCITFSNVSSEHNIIIDIHNNGDEIESDVRDKIFQSLFSTKKGGMGLGLSICKTMLEGFGGHIELLDDKQSSLCRGTTFRILFPKVEVNQ
ncbi:ATP-binding protein [Vibrio lentus]|nr:ATP-binding protein [Vibrio lentus]PMJ01683.1 hypothetical protein BCU32_07200 [Vibrio lentus]